MSYGYLGVTPNQKVANNGVFSINEVNDLVEQGYWGGSLELIEEQTLSGSVSYNYTSIKESLYDVHLLIISALTVPASSQNWGIRFYEGGVLETASVYKYAYLENGVTGNSFERRSTGESYIKIDDTGSEQWVANLYIYFYNLGDADRYSLCTFQAMPQRLTSGGSYNDSGTYMRFGGGSLPQNTTVNGIQLYNSATTSTAGTGTLYGIKQL